MEVIIGFSIFVILGVLILGVVAIIPKLTILSTESERDPNHLYSIFWQEAGFRGEKIYSAIGCCLPIILIPQNDIAAEGIIFTFIIAVGCILFHSSVYRGYPVLNCRLKIYMALIIIGLIFSGIAVRAGVLSEAIFIFIFIATGSFWGVFVVLRRAKLIQHNNARQ